jgi:hypothetical protein
MDGMAMFVEPSTTGFASAAPSEKLLRFSIGTGDATIGAAVAEEKEGLLLRAAPFVVASGGRVMGLSFAGGAILLDWSIQGSTLTTGVVALGDAGRGFWAVGFSPLTSSSSPPDTGVFARGEL